MMTMKSKGSLLVMLGILLTVGIASLIVSSESFAEEVGQTNIGVTFYGGKEPLKRKVSLSQQSNQSLIKIKTSQQQDKVSRKPLLKRIRLMHRRHYQGQVNEIARGFTALVLHVYS